MYLIFLHIVDKFVSVIIVFWKSYLNYCIWREIKKLWWQYKSHRCWRTAYSKMSSKGWIISKVFSLTYQNFQNTQVSKVRQPYERPLRTSREPRPSSQYWTCHLWPWGSQPFQSPTRSWDHWDQSMEAQAHIPIFPRCLCHQHLLKRHFYSYNFHLVLARIFKFWNLPFFGRPRPNPLRDFREFLPPERWLCTWLPLVGNPIYQNFQLSNWNRLINKW